MDTITFGKDVTVVEDCEDAWVAGTGVTSANADTTTYQRGTSSVKVIVPTAGVGAAQVLAYENFTAMDLSGKDSLAFWIYVETKSLTAGQWQFGISATNGLGGSPILIDIPAITANTWTRVVLTLTGTRTAIVSCGIYQVSDIDVVTFYIDDVIAFDSKSFNVLAVKGLTKAHGRRTWPDIETTLLDGTIDRKVSRYGRAITVSLYPVATEADVTWLMDALTLYPSVRIITSDRLEEAEVVDQLPRPVELEWSQGVDWAPTATIPFLEKAPIWSATRKPPSHA